MRILIALLGIVLIVIVLWDAFEAIVLPRRVARRLRLTRLFYRTVWGPWWVLADRVKKRRRRESVLGIFGPISLVLLLALWAAALLLGFAMIHWGIATAFSGQNHPATFFSDLYFSGTTFFTLGLGDITPLNRGGRILTVIESGTGLGLLALVIGYFPVLYQAFSRREVHIAMLDARAGTPPTAGELLRRHRDGGGLAHLDQLLRDWELWSADLLESHLSYPVLCFFRSQHDNQSWLAALTTVLDTCSLVMVGVEGVPKWQAQLTFKMARHAVVDLAQVFNTSPIKDGGARLSEAELDQLRLVLSQSGVALQEVPGDKSLSDLRAMYEPYVKVLSNYLMMPLPPWIPTPKAVDNWQTSAWEITAAGSDSIRKCMVRGATADAVRLTKAAALKSSEL